MVLMDSGRPHRVLGRKKKVRSGTLRIIRISIDYSSEIQVFGIDGELGTSLELLNNDTKNSPFTSFTFFSSSSFWNIVISRVWHPRAPFWHFPSFGFSYSFFVCLSSIVNQTSIIHREVLLNFTFLTGHQRFFLFFSSTVLSSSLWQCTQPSWKTKDRETWHYASALFSCHLFEAEWRGKVLLLETFNVHAMDLKLSSCSTWPATPEHSSHLTAQ